VRIPSDCWPAQSLRTGDLLIPGFLRPQETPNMFVGHEGTLPDRARDSPIYEAFYLTRIRPEQNSHWDQEEGSLFLLTNLTLYQPRYHTMSGTGRPKHASHSLGLISSVQKNMQSSVRHFSQVGHRITNQSRTGRREGHQHPIGAKPHRNQRQQGSRETGPTRVYAMLHLRGPPDRNY